MRHVIDPATWPRREYFDFFSRLDDPYFGVIANVDFTRCYREAKADAASFTLYSMHRILRAANAIPEFRYRIEGEEVVEYDTIHVGPTIGRKDGTFGFGFMEYRDDRTEFVRLSKCEMERVQALTGLCATGDTMLRLDTVHYSAVPWFAFTEMKHPHSLGGGNANPRISTGRLVEQEGKLLLPISLDLHHGMADGYHAGLFYRLLEDQDF